MLRAEEVMSWVEGGQGDGWGHQRPLRIHCKSHELLFCKVKAVGGPGKSRGGQRGQRGRQRGGGLLARFALPGRTPHALGLCRSPSGSSSGGCRLPTGGHLVEDPEEPPHAKRSKGVDATCSHAQQGVVTAAPITNCKVKGRGERERGGGG